MSDEEESVYDDEMEDEDDEEEEVSPKPTKSKLSVDAIEENETTRRISDDQRKADTAKTSLRLSLNSDVGIDKGGDSKKSAGNLSTKPEESAGEFQLGGNEEETAAIAPPNKSLLIELAEEDAREFDDADMEDFLPKSKFKDKSFLKLREFFESIISDLESAQRNGIPLEEIKEEFYFVWDAVQKSHDNLETLLHKDLQLSVEVADTMAKTRNLIRIAEDNPEKAVLLGKRLETAWNLVDISKAEEKRNAVRLEELEADIIVLNRNITAAANMEGRAELNELIKIRKKLTEDRDTLKKEMARMRTSMTLLQEKKLRQADKKIEFHEQIKFADEEAIAQTEALMRETARKERLEKAIKDTSLNIDVKTEELNAMEKQMSEANSKIDELERALRDQRVVNDVSAREAEQAMGKQEKLRADVDGQIALVERLASDAYKRQTELKTREDEILMIKMEGARTERQRIANVKKCEAMQETLDALENERENLRTKIQLLEKDLEKAQRRLADSKKEVEELDKQRTVVNRNLQRAAAVTGEHENQMKINVIAINNLEGELDGFKREIVSQTTTIHRLERERDYYSHEATELSYTVASRVEFIKRLDLSILEHKRRVGELEDSAKSVQLAYEGVVVEKQYSERALRDVVNEITQCAKAIRDIKFEKYTQEYRETDLKNAIIGEEERRDRLDKETAFFKTEANRMNHMAVDTQRETEALEVERSTLSVAIATGENEISTQRYYATGAEYRKLNYRRKLMLKETELRETWERWRTLHSMVRIGAYHYRNMMKEIREIRQSIVGLRQLQMQFKGNTSHVGQLRQEISALENCIAKETCMVNAIIDELKRPINIHRWRVLEAIDPDAYNLVKKINIVTQRLVDHNEHIRLQNLRIADKEHIYVDIRGVTKHLPGQETREERLYYDVLYKSKQRQLDNLKHEMYANEAQTAYFRGQVSILSKKMAALKKAYFDKMSKKNKKKAIGSNNKTSLLAITSSALPQPSERSSTTETYNDRQEGPNDQLIS